MELNAKITEQEIAIMLDMEVEEVRKIIKEMEDSKIILRYITLVNWEKVGEEKVSAFIEVRTTPQRDVGFDSVAERIYRFPEVRSARLMSGTYDLAVFIEGRTMREVSNFVATKLATIEGVVSTTTHFVLKTYKQDGVIIEDDEEDRRLVISP
ncbi:MAG: AsnC family transcriptional regulator [Peptococcaceae bacterium BRH_c4b]|nr:MAG: AsnC family transcriptional regulator [Peptococcaceae bacterium BRH_c4b]